jgi:hypothetical protein
VSAQGFIGETEARLRVSSRWEIAVVLGSRQPRKVRRPVKILRVNRRSDLCVPPYTS